MIKAFEINDLGCFTPNEFSEPDPVLLQLVSGEYVVESMVEPDGRVMAIMAYRNYWGDCWTGFILVSAFFDIEAAEELKGHFKAGMKALNAGRVQTESVADVKVRKWHEFMGFTLEGTRRKMMFNRDYDMWALLREEA